MQGNRKITDKNIYLDQSIEVVDWHHLLKPRLLFLERALPILCKTNQVIEI